MELDPREAVIIQKLLTGTSEFVRVGIARDVRDMETEKPKMHAELLIAVDNRVRTVASVPIEIGDTSDFKTLGRRFYNNRLPIAVRRAFEAVRFVNDEGTVVGWYSFPDFVRDLYGIVTCPHTRAARIYRSLV